VLLYSAMTVWVAAYSITSEEHDGDRRDEERISPPKRRSPHNDSLALTHSPIGINRARTPGSGMNGQLQGIPGLVSPGFDPRNRV